MKRIISVILICLYFSDTSASEKTVNISAGELAGSIRSECSTITKLIIKGTIDARDFKFMRDSMPVLAVVDLEDVKILSYSGNDATSSTTNFYPANEIPAEAFFVPGFHIFEGKMVQGNTVLTSIILPSNLKSIGKIAFQQCSELRGTIIIPESVISIKEYAFNGCYNIEGCVFPDMLQNIENAAFWGCWKLSSFELPISIASIGINAFDGAKGSGTLNIPYNISVIPKWTFQYCSGFTTLNLPNGLKSIKYDAFNECSGFTGDLVIPSTVTEITDGFRSCTGFSKCFIPNSVTSINSSGIYYGTFSNCTGLRTVAINNMIPVDIDTSTFQGVDKNLCELIVPMGSKTAYQSATGWGKFKNISEAIFVTLDTQSEYPVAPVTTAQSNSTIPEPSDPVREGYAFNGWYKEAECVNKWNFNIDIVNEPITLYAKWGNLSGITKTESNDLGICPNPANDILYLQNMNTSAIVEIINLHGQIIFNTQLKPGQKQIDIRSLSPDFYVIRIHSNDKTITQGLIKK